MEVGKGSSRCIVMFNLLQEETPAKMAGLFSFHSFLNHFPHTASKDNIALSIQEKAKNIFQTVNFPSGHRTKEIQPMSL